MTFDAIITHAWAVVAGVLIGLAYGKFVAVPRALRSIDRDKH